MQRYDSYKDSGIQWLGEIPSHWKTVTIKNIADSSIPNSFMDGDWIESPVIIDNGIRYLTTGNIGVGIYKEQGTGHISEETFKELNCSEVYPGDILISRLNEPIGRCCIVPDLGKRIIAAVDIVIFRPNQHFYDRLFLVYQMNCYKYSNYTALEARGTTMHRISRSMLGHIKLAIPPLKEQKAISAFLTPIISQIDEAIAQQQKMIDLLNERKQIIINNAVTKGLNPNAKMKPSGIDWIGNIPEHWEIKKLKHVCKAFGRIGFRGYSITDLVAEGEGCITLSPSNMHDGTMRYDKCTYLSWEKYEESPEIKIFDGDILFVKTGSTYGKSSIVHDLPLSATINPQLLVFKEFLCFNEYLANVLHTQIIKKQVEETVIGGTIPTISQSKILNYVFPNPPEEEQHSIVNYIDDKCKPILSAIKAAEHQIALLQERKQIIINDVVTGKVKVCNL